jgi:hypothetical protein
VCNIPETDIVKMQKAKNGSCDDEHFIVWLAERRMFLGKEIEYMSNNFLLEKPRDCKDQNPTTTRENWCKNFTPKKKKKLSNAWNRRIYKQQQAGVWLFTTSGCTAAYMNSFLHGIGFM